MHGKRNRLTRSTAGIVNWLLLFGVTGGTLAGGMLALFGTEWFGAGRYGLHDIPPGEYLPAPDEAARIVPKPKTNEGQAALREWSAMSLPNWKTKAKVTAPRILLAKLTMGVDVEEVNQYLQQARPWSGIGSNWTFHHGDYDFTVVTLTTLLYLFGEQPDRLYPETISHLLDTLLTESGGTPLVTVPRTQGLVTDTENHILMTEGSRYLKNQWLTQHGTDADRTNIAYDNAQNGLEAFLLGFLQAMDREGIYEFNSRPYVGYTIQALLNLEAYPASADIRRAARYLLDKMNLKYALGSLDFRCNPPFRRQYRHAEDTDLMNDPHTAYMRGWCGTEYHEDVNTAYTGRYSGSVLLAELLPYALPQDVQQWAMEKPSPYFVRIGRGSAACPEIYSGGPGYLISAGGANRGFRSHVVARPITLLLDDGETNISRCFHITGKGNWRRWNMTGVYDRFACGNGKVHVPETRVPVAEAEGWKLYWASPAQAMLVAVWDADDFGLLALLPAENDAPDQIIKQLVLDNPDSRMLRQQFICPDGRHLEYDVDAPIGQWVMVAESGVMLDRDYDAWPQLAGPLPVISFQR